MPVSPVRMPDPSPGSASYGFSFLLMHTLGGYSERSNDLGPCHAQGVLAQLHMLEAFGKGTNRQKISKFLNCSLYSTFPLFLKHNELKDIRGYY